MEAGIEVITALSSSATIDLGITGGDVDRYVDGDTNATGYATLTATARTIVASADTLDILVLVQIQVRVKSVYLLYYVMYQVLTKLTEIQTLSTNCCVINNFKGAICPPLIYTPYNI